MVFRGLISNVNRAYLYTRFLRRRGKSQREIAATCKVSRSSVQCICECDGQVDRSRRSRGRQKRLLSKRQERLLVRNLQKFRRTEGPFTSARLKSACGLMHVSDRTIRHAMNRLETCRIWRGAREWSSITPVPCILTEYEWQDAVDTKCRATASHTLFVVQSVHCVNCSFITFTTAFLSYGLPWWLTMPFWLITSRNTVFVQREKCITVHKQRITRSLSFQPPHSVAWQKIKRLTLNTKIEKKVSESPSL